MTTAISTDIVIFPEISLPRHCLGYSADKEMEETTELPSQNDPASALNVTEKLIHDLFEPLLHGLFFKFAIKWYCLRSSVNISR